MLFTPVPDQQSASATSSIRSASPDRPSLRGARSFSRLEPSTTNPLSRLGGELTIPEISKTVSETPSPIEEHDEEDPGKEPSSTSFPEGFDELPIELLSLTDRFIESLSAKVHPNPLSVAQLIELFQQFYISAFQQVDTHVSHSYLSLASKKPRSSPSSSKNPTQMLSREEIAQKKRDRKMLDIKRLALEEAVEKRITEGVYDRLWRHKSTDDEARDESLRSKMAALNVVGVKLGHLGVELEGVQGDIEEELRPAVEALVAMNDPKNPVGKLQSLKQAHKAIVDWLSTHNSSSSADFILPTLIYTLIISPPTQSFNIISNLFFIQRFRAKKAIDGEAAYCLTNLEAAISFLETVDLATLKVEDPDEGRPRSRSRSPLPKEESEAGTPEIPWAPVGDPLGNLTDKLAAAHANADAAAAENANKPHVKVIGANPSASSSTLSLQPPSAANAANVGGMPRRLSYLTPIDIASGAISTADQGIRGIGSTLESSYKFLFGKMEKRGEELPKTLEDARKLVDSPIIGSFDDEKFAENDGGLKRVASEASIKSTQSHKTEKETTFGTPPRSSTTPAAVAAEKLGNLGTSLGRFAVRGFTRSTTPAASATTLSQTDVLTGAAKGLGIVGAADKGHTHKRDDSAPVVDLLSTFPDLANSLPKVKMGVPPIARFLDVEDPGELRISEVGELLKDYKRLVEELRVRGALD
ncbi:uncharacterized protein H6S33_000078 [Morchella sextelata]|uniref:uncharacterized protein n=1 Tax=Morchella sextelata TaxID=1174677 RepID=UPI001D04B56D|nr:uncharacterized protein H6S33_000078 [Morchella sextelata]KAH0614442.1 hypothetical protein H6S33_000078 [Morchella sextelata]